MLRSNDLSHKAGRCLGELVTFSASDGWKLEGIFYSTPQARCTIVHVHGSMGNFYADQFVRVMAAIFGANGINLLAFNTRCHDCISEGFSSDGAFAYVGGSISRFETCVEDIEGAVQFVRGIAPEVVLQGYSLGCDRIVSFMLSSRERYRAVLLSPCDSYEIQKIWLSSLGRTVESQRQRIATMPKTREVNLLPGAEYGVRMNGEEYLNPVTASALDSIISGLPFQLFRTSESLKYELSTDALVYLGGKDPLQTSSADQVLSLLRSHFCSVEEIVVAEGDHSFSGFEEQVAERVVSWIGSTSANPNHK